MIDTTTCPRAAALADDTTPMPVCSMCGAWPHETCPLVDLDPALTDTSAAICATGPAVCNAEDTTCESCQ